MKTPIETGVAKVNGSAKATRCMHILQDDFAK